MALQHACAPYIPPMAWSFLADCVRSVPSFGYHISNCDNNGRGKERAKKMIETITAAENIVGKAICWKAIATDVAIPE